MVEELQRAGAWDGDTTLDWGVGLHNLQRALDIAISSRRRDRHVWHLNGSLIELVSPIWALTTAGVELLGRGVMASQDDFPRQFPELFANLSAAGKQPVEEARTWCPDPPDAVDPGEWERAIRHGKDVFPVSPLDDEWWVPWGSAPEHMAPAGG
jgi:hypothetical protein